MRLRQGEEHVERHRAAVQVQGREIGQVAFEMLHVQRSRVDGEGGAERFGIGLGAAFHVDARAVDQRGERGRKREVRRAQERDMKVHVADRVDHADRAVAEQDGPAFQIKIAQGEKRGIRSGIGPARRGQQFGEGKQPIAEIGDVEYRIVYAEGGLNGGGVREKPEAWPDVQPFDGQQRAVGRSRLFKVGDTDAAHGNAEGKRVDRKGFDGDGGVDGLRELAFHDAAQHRGRQGNGKGGPQGAEEADSEKTGTPAFGGTPSSGSGLLLLGLCGNGRKRRGFFDGAAFPAPLALLGSHARFLCRVAKKPFTSRMRS